MIQRRFSNVNVMETEICPCLEAGAGEGGNNTPMIMDFLMLEHHPNDSRIKIKDDGICQGLTSRMGTGGGNVPLVLCFTKERRAKDKDDFETWKESGISNTMNAFDIGDVRSTTIVVEGNDSDDDREEIF